jgi:hypothetical protein
MANKSGARYLDSTRGLDLPPTFEVQEILSWQGMIWIQCAKNGLLVKDGDRYFRVTKTPWKPKAADAPAPEPTSGEAAPLEGAPPDSAP